MKTWAGLCVGTMVLAGCGIPQDEPLGVDPVGTSQAGGTTDVATSGGETAPTVDSSGDGDSGSTTGGDSGPDPDSSGESGPDSGGGPPPGGNTDEPFPIDRGDSPDTPGTYKGLPLRLVDNGAPEVTPVDGVVGVVCIGMSNGTQECSDFIDKIESGTLAGVAPSVTVVDCAVGGHAIERWSDPAFDHDLWDRCLDRLSQNGVTPQQVRVIYHKAADQFTAEPDMMTVLPPYPDPDSDYFNFIDNLGAFAARVSGKFPSVQAVYTTSRSYGGFAGQPARGEPLSYEESHALNAWLADNPQVDGVWYGWGPYIWAPDCDLGITNGSDVCYVREDYQADGVHPAAGGLDKVSGMIHQRLLNEAWYAQ